LIQNNVVDPVFSKESAKRVTDLPLANGASNRVDGMTRCVNKNEIERDKQERETQPVIGPGFRYNHVPHMQRHVFFREPSWWSVLCAAIFSTEA